MAKIQDKTKFELMKEKLKEIFQHDKAELDFGIYRILNLKKKEVEEFIDKELEKFVNEEFSGLSEAESKFDKEKLDELKEAVEEALGEKIEILKKTENPKGKLKEYIELENKLKSSVNFEDLKEEIYDNILSFFRRYYDNGDFISKGIYSDSDKYSIPYNGDEVYLHWANKDQYYIKTTESFRDYLFNHKDYKIHFKILNEEIETEQNNNKSDEKKYFIYLNSEFDKKEKELVLNFAYRSLTKEEEKEVEEITGNSIKNETVNERNISKIKINLGIEKSSLNELDFLNSKYKNETTGKDSESSILEYHLKRYVAKNDSDYFIHKDLKGFLKRELNFYIKNEFMNLDNLGENEEEVSFDLKKINTFKKISEKIIEFLAQIEEFQKKIWEKKKFVVDTEYCLTIDYIDEKYYEDIMKNKEQIQEWINLGFIEEKTKLTKDYLRENPTLVIDTKFFPEMKWEFLGNIEDLEEKTNGILINSENFQALNLLLNKYKEKIKCCYIDPPYNTGGDGFLYKDGYSHSSWMSLMNDRLSLARDLLNSKGVLFSSIDENEVENLKKILSSAFYTSSKPLEFIWNTGHSQQQGLIASYHEYILLQSKINSNLLDNFSASGEGIIDAGAIKKISKANPKSQFKFPKGVRCDVPDGTIFRKEWGNSEKVYLEDGEFFVEGGKTKFPMTLSAGWTQKKQMQDYFYSSNEVRDTKGQLVKEFYFNSSGKLKCIKEKTRVTPSSILDEFGTVSMSTKFLEEIIPNNGFGQPKPVNLIKYICSLNTRGGSPIILDFFAGSGTTGHAVLNLNKDDEGNRKFILVEMGEYFDSVTKPRIQKVVYSQNWKDGKPVDNKGSKKQIIKYHSLEQYEDSLNNLDFEKQSQLVLDTKDYKLKYMLDFESRNNNTFMNIENLENPFDYKLSINGKEKNIDLIETFNYLANIEVQNISQKENNGHKYVIVRGKRKNKSVLVVWRNFKDIDKKKDKDFIEKELNSIKFGELFVNSDSLIKGAKSLDIIMKEEIWGGI